MPTERTLNPESLKTSQYIDGTSRVVLDDRRHSMVASSMQKSMASTNYPVEESKFGFSQVRDTRPMYFSSLMSN